MHACGHDMILAAALILAKIVAEEQRMQESFPVRLRFLFEPAEEIGESAGKDGLSRTGSNIISAIAAVAVLLLGGCAMLIARKRKGGDIE